jgi:sugar-specific transcriptional regulator TrmB
MSLINEVLSKFGLGDKEISVYRALLTLGPSPVRKVAVEAGVNRGTTYDILKNLKEQGLVSYYHKEKHQYFVAEDPNKLYESLRLKIDGFKNLQTELNAIVPQLRSMRTVEEEKPVVTYYDGAQGIRTILQDVLAKVVAAETKEYYVYSSASISRYMYAGFPEYTDERLAKNIYVKVISLGGGGESNIKLAERKWLSRDNGAPTYTIIYAGRVAMISTDKKGLPMGLIVADQGLYDTQKIIFENLWSKI